MIRMSNQEDDHFEKTESGGSDKYLMAVGSIKKGDCIPTEKSKSS